MSFYIFLFVAIYYTIYGNKKDLEIFKKRKKELELWLEKLDYYNKEITFEKILSEIKF